ncbi:serine/threonine-protein phosphatase 6 regulatory ankyrin repeat subunit C-like [Penaeus indicus]|uniref:serine/threonine-protein phosphatase 6 regulatory ankyrin repeat subunit C-like n=1 Tax=Penaeus indicus TaxID=29960 RepID=UPI00300CA47C
MAEETHVVRLDGSDPEEADTENTSDEGEEIEEEKEQRTKDKDAKKIRHSKVRTLLHLAVEREQTNTVKVLLEQGARVDECDHNGRTALLAAAEKGALEIAEALLDAGADVAAGDSQGMRAVHLAAAAGSVEMLALLKAQDCDLSVVDLQGRSPLHVAAERGQVSAVQWLLRERVSVDAASGKKQTPLDVARALGHKDVVALLEEALLADAEDVKDTAEDAEESLPSTDSEKDTKAVKIRMLDGDELDAADLCPLHQCVLAGDADAVQELVDGGANIHETGPGGRLAVHIAVEKGHLDVLETLIEAGCEIAMGDGKGRQPVHLAALGGHAALLQVLIDHSASLQNYDRKGMRAIHFAAAGGSEATLDLLLRLKCDLDLADASSRTPLHIAVLEGQCGAVEWLLTKGATASKRDIRNQSPLDVARALGRRDIEELLERRARRAPTRPQIRPQTRPQIRPQTRPQIRPQTRPLIRPLSVMADEREMRVLHLAAQAGDAGLARALVEGGADVHAEGPGGFRPIHYAARCGSVEILQLLREAKCDLKATTAEGLTALHVAVERGHFQATKWLVGCAGLDAAGATGAGVSVLDLAQRSARRSVVRYVQTILLVKTLASGDIPTLQNLLQKGLDADAVLAKNNGKGLRAVHYAASGGRVEALKVLQERKYDLKAATRQGLTALHYAAKFGHLHAVRWLAEEAGVDARQRSKRGFSALTWARKAGRAEVATYLQEHLQITEKRGKKKQKEKEHRRKDSGTSDLNSQILLISSKGDAKGVERLANAGAHLETISSLPAEKGLRPVHLASQSGHGSTLQALVRAGADPDSKGPDGFRAVHYASKGGHVEVLKALQALKVDLRALTDAGETALHVAADCGNLAAVKWLVEQAGFSDAALLAGEGSALQVARDARKKDIVKYLVHFRLANALLTGDVKALEKMLKDGINLDPNYIYNKDHGFRSVHYAAKGGHLSVLRLLNRARCILKATTPEGLTALHVAAADGRLAATKWLVGFGGLDAAGVSRAGLTAKDMAARAGSAEVVAYLQDHDVLKALLEGDTQAVRRVLQTRTDIDKLCMEKNIKGFQAVHYAAKGGQVHILKILKENKCNLKGVTYEGLTALHYAVRYAQLDVVKWLVEEGELDVSCRSKKGSSALDFARNKKKQEIAAYLEGLNQDKEGSRRARGRPKLEKEMPLVVQTQGTVTDLNSEILMMARKGDAEGVKRLAKQGANLEVKNPRARERGLRPLHLCSLAGHTAALEALVECGADIHSRGPQGLSVVHYASKGGHVEVLKVLQQLDANLMVLTDAKETALHVAADFGNLAAVKWLVELGGFERISLSREAGSAFDLARISDEKAIVQYLMNVQLLNAVICGDVSTVKELIEGGIKIDDVNVVGKREGFRIVHHAAHSGDVRILKLLNQAKCNMKAAAEKGLTALHVAAREGHAAAVRWLVERGGFATDWFGGDGVRPGELARREGQEEVARYFQDNVEKR